MSMNYIISILLYITSIYVSYKRGIYASLSLISVFIVIELKYYNEFNYLYIFAIIGSITIHLVNTYIKKINIDSEYIKSIEGELSNYQAVLRNHTENLEKILIAKELEIQNNLKRINRIEKLQSLGSIIGGVAHDFNNLLTSGYGYAEMLLDEPEIKSNPLLLRYVTNILKSMSKSSELINNILTFTKKNDNNLKFIDINIILNETLTLAKTITKQIKINTNFNAVHTTISANQTQIQNAILNIIINAKDSIELPEHGEIVIETNNVYLYPTSISPINTKIVAEGDYLCIKIKDNGSGISTENMCKIFEPFFTTKNGGNTTGGTGLGLATVYGTINTHNGYITIETFTTGNKGTTFLIYLKITKCQLDSGNSNDPIIIETCNKSIMIVDDESEILNYLTDTLSKKHNIITFNDAEVALSHIESGNTYDLILVDMIMPKLNGKDLCIKIKTLNSKQKVALATGFISTDIIDVSCFDKIIYKPFSNIKIMSEINSILNS